MGREPAGRSAGSAAHCAAGTVLRLALSFLDPGAGRLCVGSRVVRALSQPPAGPPRHHRRGARGDRRSRLCARRRAGGLAKTLQLARALAHRCRLRLLRLRKLVLFFLVSYLDGPRGGLLAERRAFYRTAFPAGLRGQPGRRRPRRPAYTALGRAHRSALDSRSLPCADRCGACGHGAFSWQGRGGGALQSRLRHHGPDASLGVGSVPGRGRALERHGYRHDEYCRPGGRISGHRAVRLHRPPERQLQPAALFLAGMVLASAFLFTRIDCEQTLDADALAQPA